MPVTMAVETRSVIDWTTVVRVRAWGVITRTIIVPWAIIVRRCSRRCTESQSTGSEAEAQPGAHRASGPPRAPRSALKARRLPRPQEQVFACVSPPRIGFGKRRHNRNFRSSFLHLHRHSDTKKTVVRATKVTLSRPSLPGPSMIWSPAKAVSWTHEELKRQSAGKCVA
jgi:hypothetical protein